MLKEPIPEEAYRNAIDNVRLELQRKYAEIFQSGIDGIIQPTTPLAATKIGEDTTVLFRGEECPTFPTFIRDTDPISLVGAPGLSIPAGFTGGDKRLPVGMEIQGPVGSDEDVLGWVLSL